MGFKPVADLDCDITIQLGGVDKKTKKKNPKTIEGYYLGARDVESKFGLAKLHVFQTDEGNVGVWGKSNLDMKLGSVDAGTMTRVTYTGKVPSKKGNDMFKYSVEIDSDNIIDANLPSIQEEGYEEAEDEIEEDDLPEDEIEEEEVEEEEEEVVAAKTKRSRSSSKQDRVKQLLKKSRTR